MLLGYMPEQTALPPDVTATEFSPTWAGSPAAAHVAKEPRRVAAHVACT